jgi:hypothetical protein
LQATGLEAGSSSAIKTLVCIRASQAKVGEYRGDNSLGPDAYEIEWHIGLVRWSDGAVIGGKTLYGSQPPERHRSLNMVGGLNRVIGSPPTVAAYTKWLRSRLFPVLLPVSKLQVQMPLDSKWTVSALEDRDRLQDPAGVMATVSIQPSRSRKQCVDILKAVAATNGGKIVYSARYVDAMHWDAMEVGEMASVCSEFPGQNVIVLAGPLDKVNREPDNLRLLLFEIYRAVARQLQDKKRERSP